MGRVNRYRSIALAGLLAFAMPCTVAAQNQTNGTTDLGKKLPPHPPAHPDEHIVMPQFPGGWTENPTESGSVEMIEYMPKGQTPATWTDKITLEIHHGTNTLPPDTFQGRALSQMRENCQGVVERPVQTGVNNGFPSAFWILGCKLDKRGAYGEVRYTKAVQGSETLYLLSRSWRTRPFADGAPPVPQQDIQQAVTFLSTSVICAEGSTHPCPTRPPK